MPFGDTNMMKVDEPVPCTPDIFRKQHSLKNKINSTKITLKKCKFFFCTKYHLNYIVLTYSLKGIYRRFTWGVRPKTTKLSLFNATNCI